MSTAITDLTRIGDGPVATVYTGHHNSAAVALKVFPKRFDKRTMSAFTKEQAKLGAVRRVTSILMADAVDELTSGETALRMELCTQSLAGLVERVGPLAAADVIILGRAAAVALTAAHSAGVVHGGVAPDNVLFRTNGEPVLGDFGVTLRHAFTRDPLHAIEYLPPETLRNGTLNEATDLYGLGAVLHFALSGRSPHPGRLGEQPGERVLRILGEPVPAINRPDVPIGLSTLVARLLSTAPERRPTDAAQVADQLTSMLPNPPKAAPREDWDDFDTPTPAAITHRPAPQRQPEPEDDLDFDDFAVPHRLAPGRSLYARPQPGGERSPYARPLPPALAAPGGGRSPHARPPMAQPPVQAAGPHPAGGALPLAGLPVAPLPHAPGALPLAGPPVAQPAPHPADLGVLPLARLSVAQGPPSQVAGLGDSPLAGPPVMPLLAADVPGALPLVGPPVAQPAAPHPADLGALPLARPSVAQVPPPHPAGLGDSLLAGSPVVESPAVHPAGPGALPLVQPLVADPAGFGDSLLAGSPVVEPPAVRPAVSGGLPLVQPPVAHPAGFGGSLLAGSSVVEPPVRASASQPGGSGELSFAGSPVASSVEADPQPATPADLPLAGPPVAESPVVESAPPPAGVGDSPFAGLTVVGSPGGPRSPGVSQQMVGVDDAPPVFQPAGSRPVMPPVAVSVGSSVVESPGAHSAVSGGLPLVQLPVADPAGFGGSLLAGSSVVEPPVRASASQPAGSGELSFAGSPVASSVEADPQPATPADLPLAGPLVVASAPPPAGVGDSPFAGLTVVSVGADDAPPVSQPAGSLPPVEASVGRSVVGSPAVAESGVDAPGASGPPMVGPSSGAGQRAPLPLAPPLTPVVSASGVDAPVTEAFPLPQLATVRFAASPGVERRSADLDFDDDGFGDFGDANRLGQAKVLAGPLAPPGQSPKRMIRYDLLAGVALLLALLALVPLLLLRGDPAEMATTPHVPSAGGSAAPEVTVELDPPTDLNTQVKLTWTASADFDFAVVIAGEGERRKWVLAERNHSMTVDVKPGVKYCFLVQATNGDQTYDSEPVALRGATCTK